VFPLQEESSDRLFELEKEEEKAMEEVEDQQKMTER
jgi:hypothetical protein